MNSIVNIEKKHKKMDNICRIYSSPEFEEEIKMKPYPLVRQDAMYDFSVVMYTTVNGKHVNVYRGGGNYYYFSYELDTSKNDGSRRIVPIYIDESLVKYQ